MELPLDTMVAADKGEAALQVLLKADLTLFLSPSAAYGASSASSSRDHSRNRRRIFRGDAC
jgi:hypothetical protein